MGIVTLDGNRFVAKEITYTVISPRGFPEAQPVSGQPNADNYLPVKFHQQSPPWSIGRLRRYHPFSVWDEENVNALFPGLLTLGPLKNVPTFSGPTTFKINAPGFIEALGKLYLYGFGAAASDEPVWSWTAGTTTWTNETLNADVNPVDVNNIAGMALLGGVLYAISRIATVETPLTRWLFQSTVSGTWLETHVAGSNETLDITTLAGTTNAYFLLPMSNGKLRTLAYESVSGDNRIQESDTTPGDSNVWAAVGTITNASSTPRGYVLWHDSAGAEATFITTSTGLYKGGTTPVLLYKLRNRRGTYTGTMIVGEDDALYVADGPNVVRFTWAEAGGGVLEAEIIGPHDYHFPGTGGGEGLPLAKQGDVVAFGVSKEHPWLYVAVGGLAASRNAWIGVYNTDTRLWNCIYKNATAQRAIIGLYESNEDDGIARLHFFEEQAAGGDQDPQNFARITSNPETDTAYTYAASGVVTGSRFTGFIDTIRKGFFTIEVYGDDIDATEKVAVKVASDGGALGASQDIETSPGVVWTDGAGAGGTDAIDIQAELTLSRDSTTTNSPKLFSFGYSYEPKALTAAGARLRQWDILLSRDQDDFTGAGEAIRPELVLTNLEATLAKRTLVALSFTEGSTAISANVLLDPFSVLMHAQERGESGKVALENIRIRVREVR